MAPTCRPPALLLALLALLARGHDASSPAVVVSGCGSLAAAYSNWNVPRLSVGVGVPGVNNFTICDGVFVQNTSGCTFYMRTTSGQLSRNDFQPLDSSGHNATPPLTYANPLSGLYLYYLARGAPTLTDAYSGNGQWMIGPMPCSVSDPYITSHYLGMNVNVTPGNAPDPHWQFLNPTSGTDDLAVIVFTDTVFPFLSPPPSPPPLPPIPTPPPPLPAGGGGGSGTGVPSRSPSPSPSPAQTAPFVVNTTAVLTGAFSASTLNTTSLANFCAAVAATLNVATSTVDVTEVADGSRGSVQIAFTVSGVGNYSALVASIAVLATNPDSFLSRLQLMLGFPTTFVTVATPSVAVVNTGDAAAATSYYASLSAGLSTLNASAALTGAAQLAASLNDPGSSLNSNATAAADVRTSVLTAIAASATSSANTSAGVENAALTVSSLVSNSSQINAAGAAVALNILLAVSSAGTSGSNVTFSQGASNAVTAALSSSVGATSTGAVDTAVLGSVFSVVNNLAGSQLAGLAAGASVEVSSPAIQMRVAVSAPGSTALFDAPLSAANSASAFAPMPPGLFANAGANATAAGVRMQFASLTFDPFLNVTTSGVTRLAFTSAGPGNAPLNVSGLTKPVYFNMSAVTLAAPGQKAACQFWDTTVTPPAYSAAGCVGLPNPTPRASELQVFWISGFNTTTDGGIAAAWNASGPLLANCTRTVLDCSDANSTQVVFPNPAQPFLYQPIKCDAAISTTHLVVFAGSRCALISEEQPCYWDNLKQAFQGAGCLAAPVQQCACRHVRTHAIPGRWLLNADASARPRAADGLCRRQQAQHSHVLAE